MNLRAASLSAVALLLGLSILAACSSDSTSGNGASADGGPGASPSGGTTFSCLVQLNGFEPQCQLYEATGADAVRTIAQLRAGCIDQSAGKAHVVEACPTENGLGGCKTPIQVKGGAVVQLFITNFEYKPTGDAGFGTHDTALQVEGFCKSQGASATYVPAP
jgi:hypothetical protein